MNTGDSTFFICYSLLNEFLTKNDKKLNLSFAIFFILINGDINIKEWHFIYDAINVAGPDPIDHPNIIIFDNSKFNCFYTYSITINESSKINFSFGLWSLYTPYPGYSINIACAPITSHNAVINVYAKSQSSEFPW